MGGLGGPHDKRSAARGSQGAAGDISPERTEGFQAPRVHDADANPRCFIRLKSIDDIMCKLEVWMGGEKNDVV